MRILLKKYGIIFPAFFFLLLCFMTYGPILGHQFMLDDGTYHASLYPHFSDFFTKVIDYHYEPFNDLLNVSLFRTFQTPCPLYLINLVLFYIDVFLLFIFVLLISKDLSVALFTGIIFCVHPMTGEILQHITFNIMLVHFFLMESGLIFLYLYACEQRNKLYYLISIIAASLALFCQEVSLPFPLYAIVTLSFLTDFDFKKIMRITAPFIFLSLSFLVLWFFMTHHGTVTLYKTGHLVNSTFWDFIASFTYLALKYISNLFVPKDILFMYNTTPLKNFIWLWGSLFFVIFGGAALWICGRFKKSIESFSLLIFFTGFLYAIPVSFFRFQVGGNFEFEPYCLYFSSIGFYLFIALMILKLKKHVNRRLYIILITVIFTGLFISTEKLNLISSDPLSYYENWLRKSPGNATAGKLLAIEYSNHKDIAIPLVFIPDMLKAVDYYMTDPHVKVTLKLIERIASSDISLSWRQALLLKSAAYYCKYGYDDQCHDTIRSILNFRNDPAAYIQLSYALYHFGVKEIPIKLLEQCIARYPQYKEAYLFAGIIFANEGRYQSAINLWEHGLWIDPADVRFLSNIKKAKTMLRSSV